MAHCHYLSPGLILGSRLQGEANRLYQILTPEFGLINALAQGVRLSKSKLRFQLSTYSLVDLDLVRGREYWRIVGVYNGWQPDSKNKSDFLPLAKKISLVISRLIHGEEKSVEIFNDLKKIWDLADSQNNNFADLEVLIMIRLLGNLGYLDQTIKSKTLLSGEISLSKILEVNGCRRNLIKLINQALVASGL